ncbi:MAG: hypothetical protein WDZ69_00305 [Candidatus Pacearchaeota archaeon]
MDQKEFLKMAAAISFLSILFTPMGSEIGFYLLIPGVVFGALWFLKLG